MVLCNLNGIGFRFDSDSGVIFVFSSIHPIHLLLLIHCMRQQQLENGKDVLKMVENIVGSCHVTDARTDAMQSEPISLRCSFLTQFFISSFIALVRDSKVVI